MMKRRRKNKQDFNAWFWQQIEVGTPKACWNWTRSARRYGQFRFNGRNYQAHRKAFELTKGPIPQGKFILHSCDNPLCCNPAHLRIGTQAENVQDAVERGRHKNPCFHGESHPMKKLTAEKVLEIRKQFESGRPKNDIARDYGIHSGHVWKIAHRLRWASI